MRRSTVWGTDLSKYLLRSLLDDAESSRSLAANRRYLPCALSRSSSARFCAASCAFTPAATP